MSTKQSPLPSGFNKRNTAQEVLQGIDLTGKLAVVTGGYSGIGIEAVKALAGAGAEVIVPARRHDVAAEALSGVARVRPATMDLASLESVRAFADSLLSEGRHIDMLINNAGIMGTPEKRVGAGWEMQFAVNHLGHFVFVNRLWPLLRGGSRVISLSSSGHGVSDIRWDDINFERGYDKWLAYGQSKTANSLFAVELDRLAAKEGVRAFAVHPGSILSPLQRHMSREELMGYGWLDAKGRPVEAILKSTQQGASTEIWAATSPKLVGMGGLYLEDNDVAPISAKLGDLGVRPYAVDSDSARRLWQISVEMTGEDAFS